MFPEANLIKSIESNYDYVFVYGNKDIRPSVLRLSKERLRRKLENWYFVQELKGEIKEHGFYVLNGNYLIYTGNSTLEEVLDYIKELKEKYCVRTSLWKANRKIKSKIVDSVKERFGKRRCDLLFGLYLTTFRGLTRVKTNANILLTHTPPYLKNSKLLFGNYPDYAIYKREKGDTGVAPAYEDDPEAIKENVGERSITKFILKNNFDLVLCGHIHEGSGISLIKETNTLVVNPGSVAAFQNKEKVTPYALIKVKEREVEVFIKSWLGDKLLTIVM